MLTAINVHKYLFGLDGLRAGDMIAACNLLEHLRKEYGNPELALYIPDEAVYDQPHCFIMRNFLAAYTSYVTMYPDHKISLFFPQGTDPTYPNLINLWNIRKDVLHRRQNVLDIDDAVRIPALNKDGSIVLAPLMDGAYNFERNWSLEYTQHLVDFWFRQDGKHWIVSKEPIPGLDAKNFTYCHDYRIALNLISKCEFYIGGDTGLSHFAGALDPSPACIFHYSKDTYGTTLPFHWKNKATIVFY